MRYWWVSQNQTYEAERDGGYLWSPKRNKNDSRSPYYDNMREVSPQDVVFSFRGGQIVSINAATSYCYEAPQPAEFGNAGQNWSLEGWRVSATYGEVRVPVRPNQHMDVLGPLLPSKYSPIRADGKGNQMYLAEIGERMANALLDLLAMAGNRVEIPTAPAEDFRLENSYLAAAESQAQDEVIASPLSETMKTAIIQARIGQGMFRQRTAALEKRCRLTKVDRLEFLVASHIKPWRFSTNDERLDGANGLLLTPTIDRLFDRGFIGFQDNGQLIVSPVLPPQVASLLGIPTTTPLETGAFSSAQQRYLQYHREFILKRAQ